MRSIFCSLLMVVFLSGCSQPEEPLRLGLLVWPPYELVYLAQAEGFLDTEQIELVDYQTPAEMMRSYRYGLIDAILTPSPFVFEGRQVLERQRVAYVIDFSTGGDSVVAQDYVDGLGGLRGRRIGVEASPFGAYVLQIALEHAELTRGDVEIVFVDTPDQEAAFNAGIIDAVVTYEPTRSNLLASGAHELINSALFPQAIADVLLVSESTLEHHGDRLSHLVQATERARQHFVQHPFESARIMAPREGLQPRQLLRAFEGARLLSLEENRELLIEGSFDAILREQAQIMVRAGLLPDVPRAEALTSPALLSEGAD